METALLVAASHGLKDSATLKDLYSQYLRMSAPERPQDTNLHRDITERWDDIVQDFERSMTKVRILDHLAV